MLGGWNGESEKLFIRSFVCLSGTFSLDFPFNVGRDLSVNLKIFVMSFQVVQAFTASRKLTFLQTCLH